MRGFVALADYQKLEAERDRLAERVRALEGERLEQLTLGDLVITFGQGISIDGRWVRLTGSELKLLELLARRAERTLTRSAIMDALYCDRSIDEEPQEKIIDIWICKLRNRLAGARGVRIETRWGEGYRLTTRAEARAQTVTRCDDMVARILRRLARAAATRRQIAGAEDFDYWQLGNWLARAVKAGLIHASRLRVDKRTHLYTITDDGRRWLAEREGEAEAIAAPELVARH